MPDHVFLKDAKGRFILDNAAHRRYLGLAEDESIEGRTVFDYYAEPVAKQYPGRTTATSSRPASRS